LTVLDLRTYTIFTQYWTGKPTVTFSQYWSGEPIEPIPVLVRTFTQYWTGEPIEPFPRIGLGNLEPFPVLNWGTYRTFLQYWTWELIEPFHRTGLGNLEYFSSTALGKLEP